MSREAWELASILSGTTIPACVAAWFAYAAKRSAVQSKHTAGEARDSAQEAADNSAPVSNGWTKSVTSRLTGIDGRLEVLGQLFQQAIAAQAQQAAILGRHLEAHAERDLNGKGK